MASASHRKRLAELERQLFPNNRYRYNEVDIATRQHQRRILFSAEVARSLKMPGLQNVNLHHVAKIMHNTPRGDFERDEMLYPLYDLKRDSSGITAAKLRNMEQMADLRKYLTGIEIMRDIAYRVYGLDRLAQFFREQEMKIYAPHR